MHESRRLDGEPINLPKIKLTDAAIAAFKAAMSDMGDDVLRLEVNAHFVHSLAFGPPEPSDVKVEAGGLSIAMDRESARRADGLCIDYVDGGPGGGGFKLDNPNEPPKVRNISARELRAKLDAGEDLELLDVRTTREMELAKLPGFRLFNAGSPADVASLPQGKPLVMLCHHGMRSRVAAERMIAAGFPVVYNVEGGIDAWSRLVDPSVPRY